MRGIILAGGNGTRLRPLTLVTNKHLLPVYDQPMIYYPIATLRDSGIQDIMVVTGKEHMGDIFRLLGSGEAHRASFTYRVQDEAGGIAQALGLAEKWANGQPVAVILGDNIFTQRINAVPDQRWDLAHIFLAKSDQPERFGCARFNDDGHLVEIVEKPKNPPSDLIVTGLYTYPPDVFDVVKTLKPSDRGELEITDVNNHYLSEQRLTSKEVTGHWVDAGTVDDLLNASNFVREARGAERTKS